MSTADMLGLVRLGRLKALRLRAALSQRDLAKKAGITHATIVRLEQGESAFPSTARKLAAALGIEPHELMTPSDLEEQA